MPRNLTSVCVRLDPETITRLRSLAADAARLQISDGHGLRPPGYNRSQLIRHALTAGLDLLTDQPAIDLEGPPPCPTGTQNRQTTSDDPASA